MNAHLTRAQCLRQPSMIFSGSSFFDCRRLGYVSSGLPLGILKLLFTQGVCLQYFDTVDSVAGRASGL